MAFCVMRSTSAWKSAKLSYSWLLAFFCTNRDQSRTLSRTTLKQHKPSVSKLARNPVLYRSKRQLQVPVKDHPWPD
jgi:hypothetical protein